MWEKAQSCKAAFGEKKTIAVLGAQWKAAYDLQAEMKLNSREMVGLKWCSKEHGLQYERMPFLREGGMKGGGGSPARISPPILLSVSCNCERFWKASSQGEEWSVIC